MKHRYSSRTAIGALVVLLAVIVALWLLLFGGEASATIEPKLVPVIVFDERIPIVPGNTPEQLITLPPVGFDVVKVEIIGVLGGWSSIESLWAPAESTAVITPFWEASLRWGWFFPLSTSRMDWNHRNTLLINDREYTDEPRIPLKSRVHQHRSTEITGDFGGVRDYNWRIYWTADAGTWFSGPGGIMSYGGDAWFDLQVVYWYTELPSFAPPQGERQTVVLPSWLLTTVGEQEPPQRVDFITGTKEAK